MKSNRTARLIRVYHTDVLTVERELQLSKQASHHLVTVLRVRKLDAIQLFNGDGYNYTATVLDTGQRTPGKCALLHITQRCATSTESPLHLVLAQAISRSDRMDASMRQAVELGVNHVQPLYSRHSAKVLDEKRTQKKMEHWENIIISASEQSGRTTIPTINPPLHLSVWLDQLAQSSNNDIEDTSVFYILSPTAALSMTEQLSIHTEPKARLGFLIGPESGFDSNEIDHAVSTGVLAVRCGPRILRTETAGPACIAIAQSMFGDLGE